MISAHTGTREGLGVDMAYWWNLLEDLTVGQDLVILPDDLPGAQEPPAPVLLNRPVPHLRHQHYRQRVQTDRVSRERRHKYSVCAIFTIAYVASLTHPLPTQTTVTKL